MALPKAGPGEDQLLSAEVKSHPPFKWLACLLQIELHRARRTMHNDFLPWMIMQSYGLDRVCSSIMKEQWIGINMSQRDSVEVVAPRSDSGSVWWIYSLGGAYDTQVWVY